MPKQKVDLDHLSLVADRYDAPSIAHATDMYGGSRSAPSIGSGRKPSGGPGSRMGRFPFGATFHFR